MQCRYGMYLALLLASVQACQKHLPDSELVARINGKPIEKVRYEAQVAMNLARYGGSGQPLPPGTETRIRESVLKRMKEDELIRQKATSLGIQLDDEKVEQRFAELKAHFRTDEAFQDYLKRSSNTEQQIREDIGKTMLRDMLADKLISHQPVTPEQVEEHYKANQQRYLEPEQRHIQRILWSYAPGSSVADQQALRKKVEKHAAMLRKQPEKLHQMNESGWGKLDGAIMTDLGQVRKESSDPVIKSAFTTSEPGLVPEPVAVTQGIALVHVQKIQPARQKPLEEIREDIKRQLEMRQANDQKRQMVNELEKVAKIEMLYNPGQALGSAPGVPPSADQVPHLVDKVPGQGERQGAEQEPHSNVHP